MKLKSSKNKVVIPLLLAVTVIWAIIISRAVGYFKSDDTTEEIISSTAAEPVINRTDKDELTDGTTLTYSDLKRDPFSLPARKKNTSSKGTLNKKHPVPHFVLNYKINGVIINDASRLAIFEDLTNKKTLFLREGEKYLDITIKKIKAGSLDLVENGQLRKISLEK